MCLERINNSLIDNLPKTKKCYKVMYYWDGELTPSIFSDGIVFKSGVNICKEPIKHNEAYVPYFHIFMTEKGAESWLTSIEEVIVPVYVNREDVTTAGYENDYPILIAKKFTIKKKDYDKVMEGD